MGLNILKRNTDDPLLRAFLDKYRLNLLLVPRTNLFPGSVYRNDGKSQHASGPGNIKHLLEPEFEMPATTTGETVAGISALISNSHSADVVLDFLEGFLNALASAVGTEIRATFELSDAKTARFSFSSITRDYVDPIELGKKLGKGSYKMMKDNALYVEGHRYYVVTSVWRSPAISIMAEDSNHKNIDVSVSALQQLIGKGSTKISVNKSSLGKITFNGENRAAFGVELYELAYDNEQDRFLLKDVERSYKLRGETYVEKTIEPVFLGDSQADSVFITLDEGKQEI